MIRDALICLAEAPFNSLALVTGIDRSRDTGEVRASKSGDWAYRVVKDGFRYEPVSTWGGWYASPTGFSTWEEIDRALAGDPRVPAARSWAEEALAARVDGWRDVMRPYRLTPDHESWHPSYLTEETQREGWETRLHHWEGVIAACRDAAATQPYQQTIFDALEAT